MSSPPLQPSDGLKIDIWKKLIEFSDILITNFNLNSLIAFVSNEYELAAHHMPKIWLDPGVTDHYDKGLPEFDTILINNRLPSMEEAFVSREISILKNDDFLGQSDGSFLIAFPLLVNDQIFGVVQLELPDAIQKTDPEMMYCLILSSQLSYGLWSLINYTPEQFRRKSNEFSIKANEIGKSILSNLDRNSLYNNLITQIHQNFGFDQISLYLLRGEQNSSVTRVGMIDNEISPPKLFQMKQENIPVCWSIDQKLPIISNNTPIDLAVLNSLTTPDFGSLCTLPLLDRGDLVGILELSDKQTDLFGLDTIPGLALLLQDINTAIRNTDIFYYEQVQSQIDEHLRETIGIITADTSLDEMQQKVLYELKSFINWDAAAIWLFEDIEDAGSGEYISELRLGALQVSEKLKLTQIQSTISDEELVLERYYERTVAESELLSVYPWLEAILNSKFPLIRDGGSDPEPLGELLGFTQEYSSIGALLINAEKPIGLILLVDHQPDQYDFISQYILNAYNNAASVLITNARLFTAAHSQAWLSTVMLQVAGAIQSITDLDELLSTLADILPELLATQACEIYLWDQSIEAFVPSGQSGFDETQSEILNTVNIFHGMIPAFDDLTQDLRPVILSSDTLSSELANQFFPDYDFESDLVIIFPLISQNNLCGALLLDFTGSDLKISSPQRIWDEKFALIEGISRQSAAAIENLSLLQSQEEEAYISVALLQVTQAIVSYSELNEILSSIVRITPILVGVKRCIVYLWDEKDRAYHQSESFGFSKPELDSLSRIIGDSDFPLIQTIHRELQIVCHPLDADEQADKWKEISAVDYQVVEANQAESNGGVTIKLNDTSLITADKLLIGFPLTVHGEFLGAMLVEEEDQSKKARFHHVRERRIEIVQGITQQAAIAVKNDLLKQEAVKSERMERELQLAREIQSTFLPDRLPQLLGWEIDAHWLPARQVAGDFYDVLILDDDRIGIVIADVADKGMPAALFMILIRTLIRAAAKDQLSPAIVLKQVNDLLVPDSKNSMFVTVFYGVLSLSSGVITYANAGHNPPFIKKIDSNVLIELMPTAMALGIFDDMTVDQKEELIDQDEWILLYTDGITEAFSADERMYGIDRLYDLVKNSRYSSPNELINKIENAVDEFADGVEISDDRTLVVLHRKS